MGKPDDPHEGRRRQSLTSCPVSTQASWHAHTHIQTPTNTPINVTLKKKVTKTTKEGPERKAKPKKHLRQKVRLSKQSLRF